MTSSALTSAPALRLCGAQLSDNWRAPRFLRMHRVDSSELFLEPEYAMVFD